MPQGKPSGPMMVFDQNQIHLIITTEAQSKIILLVLGVDGEYCFVQNLYDLFHADRCPSLAGKPKLFLMGMDLCLGKI